MDGGVTQINGEVKSVIYHNEENGYTVLKLEVNDGEVTVVGYIPFAAPGEELNLVGEWSRHPSLGEPNSLRRSGLSAVYQERLIPYMSIWHPERLRVLDLRRLCSL